MPPYNDEADDDDDDTAQEDSSMADVLPDEDDGNEEEETEDDDDESDSTVEAVEADPDDDDPDNVRMEEESGEDEDEDDDGSEEEEEPLKEPAVAVPPPQPRPIPRIRLKLRLPPREGGGIATSATPSGGSTSIPSSVASSPRSSAGGGGGGVSDDNSSSPVAAAVDAATVTHNMTSVGLSGKQLPADTTATTEPPETADIVSVGGHKSKPKKTHLPLKRVSPAGFLKKVVPSANDSVASGNSNTTGGGGGGTTAKKSRIRSLKLPLTKKPSAEDSQADTTAEVSATTRTTPSGGTYTKRRTLNPGTKSVKLPPIVSPGLLDKTTTTPAQLFDQAMQGAGYQPETSLHRGSSIRRTVGDMFDSNVMLTLHFPRMVPPDMFGPPPSMSAAATTSATPDKDNSSSSSSCSASNMDNKVTADTVIDALRQSIGSVNGNNNGEQPFIPMQDMLPVSLTMPLPDSYVEERLKYVRSVEERERAITIKQNVEEEVDFSGADPVDVQVPPIPTPPKPFSWTGEGDEANTNNGHSQHPLYPPKDANLVAHLDPQMFHITEGRYYGLLSNTLWDPNFVGPILGGSGGGTLATGTSNANQPLTLSSVLFSTTSSSAGIASNTTTQSQSNTGARSATTATTTTIESGKSTPVSADADSANADGVNAKQE